MLAAVKNYFSTLTRDTGDCWNRFWFTPVDQRPLDALRIAFGCIAFYLLATLLPDLTRYFADGGLLPVETVQAIEGKFYIPSYLEFLHTPGELLAVHIAGMIAVALFTFGIFPSITSTLSLVALLATVHRAPMITSQVEPVVTMVLFYLFVGPSGPFAAVVRMIQGIPRPQISTWAGVTLRLIQVHVVMLYATMGLSKLMGATWWNGSGTWWLMARPESRLIDLTWLSGIEFADTPVGQYIFHLWSLEVVAFEIAFAIWIWNRTLRPLLIGWSVVHWLAIGLLLGQLPLTVTMIALNLAFVPAELLYRRTTSAAR